MKKNQPASSKVWILSYKMMNAELDLTTTLIVDDSASIRNLLSHQLMSMGCLCSEARDGAEALYLLNRNHYDLICMDIEMPKINGLEVIRELRHIVLDHQPYVIVISGSDNLHLKEKCYRMGADYFLSKPYQPLQLRKAIDLFRQIAAEDLHLEFAGGGT